MSILPDFEAWLQAQRANGMMQVRISGTKPGQIHLIDLENSECPQFTPSAPSFDVQKSILAAEQAIANGQVRTFAAPA